MHQHFVFLGLNLMIIAFYFLLSNLDIHKELIIAMLTSVQNSIYKQEQSKSATYARGHWISECFGLMNTSKEKYVNVISNRSNGLKFVCEYRKTQIIIQIVH